VKILCKKAAEPRFWEKPKTQQVIGCGLFFLFGMGFMGALQSIVVSSQANRSADNPVASIDASRTHPAAHVVATEGGEFEYMRLPLEEPRAFLPDTSQPLSRPRWVFRNYTRRQLANLIDACEFTAAQRKSLLESAHPEAVQNALVIVPPPDLVLDMSVSARQRIYSVLSQCSLNSPQCHPFRFRPETFEQWCAESGLRDESLQILRKLTYRQANSLCFCDGAVAQTVLSPEQFQRLVKSLYGERTFIMRLLITPKTNIDVLARYWRKGGRVHAIRPLLESMKKIPGGAGLNISFLLPTFAETRLYTYADATTDSEVAKENCFWTALNFFNDDPDPRFFSIENSRRALAEDYQAISSRPAYGDIVVWENASGAPIHMCVYLADDVVFTKNGSDHMQPWVLMKIADLVAYYESHEPSRMRFYRSKRD
jgi:hypothetical protein